VLHKSYEFPSNLAACDFVRLSGLYLYALRGDLVDVWIPRGLGIEYDLLAGTLGAMELSSWASDASKAKGRNE